MSAKKTDNKKTDASKDEMPKQRRLYKSRDDKIVDGVFGGIAEYFGVDSTLVRIVGVLMLFAQPGAFILFYIIASIIIPEKPLSEKESMGDESKSMEKRGLKTQGNMLFGGILIVLGILFLLRNFFSWLSWDYLWPVLVIVIGIYMAMRR